MKPGETVHLGDGAYLHYTGYSFELRANSHKHPSDIVFVEINGMTELIRHVFATLPGIKEKVL